MLDSYPFAKSHKRGIIGQGIHLNTCHSLYPKNVTKTSDCIVSSSTPSFSATRYWKSTYDEKGRTWTYNYQPFQTSALPVELSSQMWLSLKTAPPQAAVSGNLIAEVLDNANGTYPSWYSEVGSNHQPDDYKSSVLTDWTIRINIRLIYVLKEPLTSQVSYKAT